MVECTDEYTTIYISFRWLMRYSLIESAVFMNFAVYLPVSILSWWLDNLNLDIEIRSVILCIFVSRILLYIDEKYPFPYGKLLRWLICGIPGKHLKILCVLNILLLLLPTGVSNYNPFIWRFSYIICHFWTAILSQFLMQFFLS